MTSSTLPIPFSRVFTMSELRELKHEITLDAKPQECAALAAMFGIVAIRDLSADFRVTRRASREWLVTGKVQAFVTQTCVVTLEPFETAVSEPIEERFIEPAEARGRAPEVILSGLEVDPPEVIVGGRLDLGGLAAEFLALALDPWPRKPGVEFKEQGDELVRPSPFAGLSEKLAKRKD